MSPRGVPRADETAGTLTWTSGFGSVTARAHDDVVVDGLNEAGLAGHLMWLPEPDYATPDDTRPRLSRARWLQYLLDNFAAVADAVRWIDRTAVQVIPRTTRSGSSSRVHVALADARGDSCVVEYIDGFPRIYHDRSYRVVTESPIYSEQLIRARRGTPDVPAPLPDSIDGRDRFARAQYLVNRLPQPQNPAEAVDGMLHVLGSVTQPEDAGHGAVPTRWQFVADLTGLRYHLRSATEPALAWADLDDLDARAGTSPVTLELPGDGGMTGDLSDCFAQAS